jgi:hypothetical protein
MKPSQALQKLDALLDTPEKYVKEVWASDAAGKAVDYDAKDAVCFCIIGGLRRVCNIRQFAYTMDFCDLYHQARNALSLAVRSYETYGGHEGVMNFNDSPRVCFEDVKKVIQRAIGIAQQQEREGAEHV